MDYVMVPVPEEYVVDVMRHVARLVARASVIPWDDESLVDLFEEVDEVSRTVLSLVARNASSGKDVSEEDVAQAVELNVRELRSIVRDINEVATRDKREPALALREVPVVLRNGRTVQRRMFTMNEAVARSIKAHERSSLGGSPSVAADPPE
jgi:dsDNA-specific endonuclease/ATPase MutS2